MGAKDGLVEEGREARRRSGATFMIQHGPSSQPMIEDRVEGDTNALRLFQPESGKIPPRRCGFFKPTLCNKRGLIFSDIWLLSQVAEDIQPMCACGGPVCRQSRGVERLGRLERLHVNGLRVIDGTCFSCRRPDAAEV